MWYRFTATATSMYLNIDLTATSGCHISSNVYSSTGACAGLTQISCLSGAPIDDLHSLTGLTIGGQYYVQVCYAPGGPCGNNGSAQFCVRVGTPDPPCNTCSTPCGDAYGYTTAPAVAQVVANCQSPPFGPPLQANSVNTFCNSFTATNTTVSFNVVITSDCGAGNVTAFSWSLYNSPSCGGAIQTGTLANLNFTGLTIGSSYVFCYTFTVPAGCTHTQHCPYFVGATVPLPVTWLGVFARDVGDGGVEVEWITASEMDVSHFVVERSIDAQYFESVGSLPAKGHANASAQYQLLDPHPYHGVSYYRVMEVDNDGTTDPSNTVAVSHGMGITGMVIQPNPSSDDARLTFRTSARGWVALRMHDTFGRLVWSLELLAEEGPNTVPLTVQLAKGVYSISLLAADEQEVVRFFKE